MKRPTNTSRALLAVLASGCTGTALAGEEGGVTTMMEAGETETGPPPDMGETGAEGVCGDGTLDPGEACDDGNLVEGDGCTAACELGPCAWEWAASTSIPLHGENGVLVSTPTLIDGDEALIAHATGPAGEQVTWLSRSSLVDGALGAPLELDLQVGDDAPYAMAWAPGGDLFMGHSDYELGLAEVRRLSPEGEVLWTYGHEAWGAVSGLALAANGDLVLVSSIQVTDEDRDALIIGLDPADGSERWLQTYSGPLAPNGYSLDIGGPLALDAQGRRFVAVGEYRDWDTLTAVVVAYAPGDAGAPLWVGEVELPGKEVVIGDLSLAPGGQVVVGYVETGGTNPFALSSFDVETGAPLWTFERDELEGDFEWSRISALAVSEDRIMALGSWYTEGDTGLRAYALGLELDGTLRCFTSLTNAELGDPGLSLNAAAMVWTGTDFFVSGLAVAEGFADVQLLRAKVR